MRRVGSLALGSLIAITAVSSLLPAAAQTSPVRVYDRCTGADHPPFLRTYVEVGGRSYAIVAGATDQPAGTQFSGTLDGSGRSVQATDVTDEQGKFLLGFPLQSFGTYSYRVMGPGGAEVMSGPLVVDASEPPCDRALLTGGPIVTPTTTTPTTTPSPTTTPPPTHSGEDEDRGQGTSSSDGDSDLLWYLLTMVGLITLVGGWIFYNRGPGETVPIGDDPRDDGDAHAYSIRAVNWTAVPSVLGSYPPYDEYIETIEGMGRPDTYALPLVPFQSGDLPLPPKSKSPWYIPQKRYAARLYVVYRVVRNGVVERITQTLEVEVRDSAAIEVPPPPPEEPTTDDPDQPKEKKEAPPLFANEMLAGPKDKPLARQLRDKQREVEETGTADVMTLVTHHFREPGSERIFEQLLTQHVERPMENDQNQEAKVEGRLVDAAVVFVPIEQVAEGTWENVKGFVDQHARGLAGMGGAAAGGAAGGVAGAPGAVVGGAAGESLATSLYDSIKSYFRGNPNDVVAVAGLAGSYLDGSRSRKIPMYPTAAGRPKGSGGLMLVGRPELVSFAPQKIHGSNAWMIELGWHAHVYIVRKPVV